VVTWDGDDSDNDDEESSSDNEKPNRRAIASIALSNKPSLFSTTSTYLMAKPTKVKYDDSNDDSYDSDSCRSDDDEDEDYSKDDLMDIINQMSKGYKKISKMSKMLEQELIAKSNENKELVDELDALKKSKECKGLEQELKALRKSFDEIQASRECLKEDYEDLEIAHSRLKKAHSTLLELVKEKDIMLEKLKKKVVVEQVIVTCDVGLTCDLIDDYFHSPIIVESTNPSCSTSTSISTISDGFTCDASLIVENETLKKEVNELNHALDKAYGGEARLLKCLGS
jgi:hypothetical protein